MNKTLQEKIEENRIIFITSNLDSATTSDIIFNLMKWSNEDEKQEIQLYISSTTGYFTNAIAIYDVLGTIPNPVSCYCIGCIGNFALLFLARAKKGKRFALNHTVFSLNQPCGSIGNGENQQTEIEIEAKETTYQRSIFEKILSESFNISLEKVHELCEEEKQLKANEAVELGIIDKILE